ncbi:transcriptional regulator [Amycolatopsis antarctica]|uniref:Transcriptional regulator n=1 Tax=Amycolatopsis antarctica TaxID=1854586 RepID=A0A263D851_9PSEU|nr:helix-turn-helix transcriptional regulator [Amycolatopsis antarctica]OZM73727.1 transcriptional regulator [Amycolatopsis antarctica]
MAEPETTVRSRELGEELRRVLTRAGLTGKQVAHQLDWAQSDISRMLTGRRRMKETDVATFLGICRVRGRERERILALCREANRSGWHQQHGSRLPKQLRTLIDHEDNALRMAEYEGALVPGLLQTGDYARAVISRIANVPEGEVDERVAARLARAAIFGRRTPARYVFYLHEFALRLPVGEAAVMSEQLHHLLRLAVRPYLSLRIVPAAHGAHAGLAGSFRLMEFAAIKPVVYLESETSTLFLEEDAEIAAYRNILAALADTALDERQSRDLIGNLAIELYHDPEDHHVHP